MKIGTVIKKYRKDLGMTQEEMANRLGVTAPAVNKWEKNNTLPDVALLAPIARLLGITTDELLSFKDELTTEEITQIVFQVKKDLKEKDFDTAFLLAKRKIEEYPNCEQLILEVSGGFISWLIYYKKGVVSCIDTIIEWNEKCLDSKDEAIRQIAILNLFNSYCYIKEDYKMALHYVKYLPDEKTLMIRKSLEAEVYSKIGKRDEAYKIYEKLVFSGYGCLYSALNKLCSLYMYDGNHKMANKLVNISSTIARVLEMGKVHEIGGMELEIAASEKNVEKTEQIMRDMLDSIESHSDFRSSTLYQHLTFNDMGCNEKKCSGPNLVEWRKLLIESYKDKKFDYMSENKWWKDLVSSND